MERLPRFVAFQALCCCMWKWTTSIDHLSTQAFKFGRFCILSIPISFNFFHYYLNIGVETEHVPMVLTMSLFNLLFIVWWSPMPWVLSCVHLSLIISTFTFIIHYDVYICRGRRCGHDRTVVKSMDISIHDFDTVTSLL